MTGADVASLLGSWDPDWLAVAEEKDRNMDKDVQSTSSSEELAEGGAVATCLGAAASRRAVADQLASSQRFSCAYLGDALQNKLSAIRAL